MGYVSYFSFFSSLKQIIHDVGVDFSNRKGEDASRLDADYHIFVHKLSSRCSAYSKSCILGRSFLVSDYQHRICSVVDGDIELRFIRLTEITDVFIRRCL